MQARTKDKASKNSVIVLDDNKKYLVLDCRKLVKWLGEPKGYLLDLKEIKDENWDKQKSFRNCY